MIMMTMVSKRTEEKKKEILKKKILKALPWDETGAFTKRTLFLYIL